MEGIIPRYGLEQVVRSIAHHAFVRCLSHAEEAQSGRGHAWLDDLAYLRRVAYEPTRSGFDWPDQSDPSSWKESRPAWEPTE